MYIFVSCIPCKKVGMGLGAKGQEENFRKLAPPKFLISAGRRREGSSGEQWG